MSATKHVVPLSYLTEKLPCFGIKGGTEDVGSTGCVDDGMIVLL